MNLTHHYEGSTRYLAAPKPCPFCDIIAGRLPVTIVRAWLDGLAIVPLNPVTKGHLLVIPMRHVEDFTSDPDLSGRMMTYESELASAPCNIITSAGREATQSVFHLHLHIVPRSDNDGLALPWYSGKTIGNLGSSND